MEPSISFFYQCYKQPAACRNAIESIRRIYKEAPIFLFNDGGDPVHEDIAKAFPNVHYTLCERSSKLDCGNYPGDAKATRNYFARILTAIEGSSADYMLMMEDDVLLLRAIDLSALTCDLNGAHSMSHGHRVNDYMNWSKHNSELLHSGFGGTVMRTRFFRRVLTDPLLSSHLDTFFNELRPGPAGCDLLLTFITYVYGGTIGRYSGLCEKNWPDYGRRMAEGSIDVLHLYKDLYV